jgi:beta-galactosidase/beta-glucuronidase
MHLATILGAGAVLLSHLALGYEVQTPPLDTPWTYKVGTSPWPEYPRPLLQRPQWKNLNGIWQWRAASDGETMPPVNETLTQDVLIPSCLESGISGVQQLNVTYAWFARDFTVPSEWLGSKDRIILNFEAVDYEATVYINGRQAVHNVGGYWHFSVDATKLIRPGNNQLYAVFHFILLIHMYTAFSGTDVCTAWQPRAGL